MPEGDAHVPTPVAAHPESPIARPSEAASDPPVAVHPSAAVRPLAFARRRRDRLPLWVVLVACALLLVVTVTLGVGIGSVSLSPRGVAGHRGPSRRPSEEHGG